MGITRQLPSAAIQEAKDTLYKYGNRVSQETWQSIKSPDHTLEYLQYELSFVMPQTLEEMVKEIKPNIPWADEHFKERVSGIPFNPPPSAEIWPHNNGSQEFREQEQYSHTYPERFHPRLANKHHVEDIKRVDVINSRLKAYRNRGIRYELGDLRDLVTLLKGDITTRQAFLPIWFPEDTGAVEGQRVPCTLGYDFIVRNGFIHMSYYMRSCDIVRHMRDDIYLAVRLAKYIADKIRPKGQLKLGRFNMYIKSLHCFWSEKEILKQSNI